MPICSHNSISTEIKSDVLIIGGGAAGHLAAITCARNAPSNVAINLLEGSPRLLSKVRISGGGRCNVTSAAHGNDIREFAEQYPRGSREMLAVLSSFGPQQACQFFEDEGVALKAEPGGKVFPVSDSSETVIAALTNACREGGVQTYTNTRVKELRRMEGNFVGYKADVGSNKRFTADYVVIATGSAALAHQWAKVLGHKIIPTVPSLFTFGIKDPRLNGLAGVAVSDCMVSLQLPKDGKKKITNMKRYNGLTQRGPLLVTHWGLSGPAVLSLSAFGARVLQENSYTMKCKVDWVPSMSLSEKEEILLVCRRSMKNKGILSMSPFRAKIPKRMWIALVRHVDGVDQDMKWSSLSNGLISKIAGAIHGSVFDIHSKGVFKDEFVTAGGIDLKDINTKTFESRHSPGLYFAGETLDVDGRTGGYNLEFAWSSGYLAGQAIATALQTRREQSQYTDKVQQSFSA